MADVVNLRRARKAKARTVKAREAAENRVRHGMTRAERVALRAEEEAEARRHDQRRLTGANDARDDRRPAAGQAPAAPGDAHRASAAHGHGTAPVSREGRPDPDAPERRR